MSSSQFNPAQFNQADFFIHLGQQFRIFENQLHYLTELSKQKLTGAVPFQTTILEFKNLADVHKKKVLLEKHKILLDRLSKIQLDNSWKLEIDNWCNEWTMWIYRCNFTVGQRIAN